MNLITSRDHALRVAVWSVIASEAVAFVTLLALHGAPLGTPRRGALLIALATTGLLVASCTAMAVARRRTREGKTAQAAHQLRLAGIAGFGALALELAGSRFARLTDPLGLAIVGLHAAHVAAGIALALWVLALVQCRRVHRLRNDVLSLVASYWYFVAGVWAFVWPVLTVARA